jgi:hypothetical protein
MENLLDLKMPRVMELGREELKENEGGSILGGIAALLGTGLLVSATWEVIRDGSAQCWEDFKEGYNSTQKN